MYITFFIFDCEVILYLFLIFCGQSTKHLLASLNNEMLASCEHDHEPRYQRVGAHLLRASYFLYYLQFRFDLFSHLKALPYLNWAYRTG